MKRSQPWARKNRCVKSVSKLGKAAIPKHRMEIARRHMRRGMYDQHNNDTRSSSSRIRNKNSDNNIGTPAPHMRTKDKESALNPCEIDLRNEEEEEEEQIIKVN